MTQMAKTNYLTKSTPLISVITPAFNCELYIEEAIKSILQQNFTDFEYIMLDDCSSDKTFEIIKKYAKIDSRIIPIQNEVNLDIAQNRNKGIELARGKYIAWQDADDISYPYRLKFQVEHMEKHSEVGICGGYLESFNEQGILDVREYPAEDKNLRKKIFLFSPVAQPAAMIRKECFEKIGKFNPMYPPAEDLDMSFRIGMYYQFANLRKVVLKYREHSSSATFKRVRFQTHASIKIRLQYLFNKHYPFNPMNFLALLITWGLSFLPAKNINKIFKSIKSYLHK